MKPEASLYSRQQLGQLAGLDDNTLNYWSREKLLIPTEGGKGRGSHRRFSFLQVNIAAILAHLRPFGFNIGVLRSLADLLQRGAALGEGSDLHPGNYDIAARLADLLAQFRSGVPVLVHKNRKAGDPPPDVMGAAYGAWLTAKVPATSEDEIFDDYFHYISDYDPDAEVIAFAEKIGAGRVTEAKIYADLVFDIFAPGYSDSYSWLLGFRPDESWRIEFSIDGAKFFEGAGGLAPDDFGVGIYVPVSGIIRNVWGLRPSREIGRETMAAKIAQFLAESGISATVALSENGFSVDAPGVAASTVNAVLKNSIYKLWFVSDDGQEDRQ